MTLGIEPFLGRGFSSEEDQRGADRVAIRWPSGTLRVAPGPIAAGSLVTVYEEPGESPDGSGFASISAAASI